MLVEVWSNLISVMQTILPMLSPANRLKVTQIIQWAQSQPNRPSGINQLEINQVVTILKAIRPHIPQAQQEKINASIYFLDALNGKPIASFLTHQGTCQWWGFFWYDNSCHTDAKVVIKECRDYKNQGDCNSNGCYWYNGSCHSIPKPPPPPAEFYKTQNTCLSAGFMWWDGSCHDQAKPPPPDRPPPPPPPPAELECPHYLTEVKCLSNGCFWWGGACHDTPEVEPPGKANPLREFAKQVQTHCGTIPLTRPLEIINCGILHAILTITADVFEGLKVKS